MNVRRIRVYWGANPEKGETGVALAEHADTLQLTERLWEIKSAAVLGDDQCARREKRSGAKKGEDAPVFVGAGIGGIEKNDVERSACRSVFRGEALQGPQGVEFENPRATAYAEGIEILLNKSGCGQMILDEHDFRCAAAKRFDADGAGAGEHIEEVATGNAPGEDVEK